MLCRNGPLFGKIDPYPEQVYLGLHTVVDLYRSLFTHIQCSAWEFNEYASCGELNCDIQHDVPHS